MAKSTSRHPSPPPASKDTDRGRIAPVMDRVPLLLRAFSAHAAAVPVVMLAARAGLLAQPYVIALVEGMLAAVLSRLLRLPGWWQLFQLFFASALVFGLSLHADPLWYLGGFLLLALLFGAVHVTRVPLFLSNDSALAGLIGCLPERRPLAFLDAGCGVGTALAAVSRAHPDIQCTGVEAAPLPWLVAALRGIVGRHAFTVKYASIWRLDLSRWDVVYAYLSPAAMPGFWDKARREMRAGTMLISNSFPAPASAVPDAVIPWGGGEGQVLYAYRM